jgi:hypothetical protein
MYFFSTASARQPALGRVLKILALYVHNTIPFQLLKTADPKLTGALAIITIGANFRWH